MPRPREKKTLKDSKCHTIEPVQRVMHEENNPSISDEFISFYVS
jgi:hypothetical protein